MAVIKTNLRCDLQKAVEVQYLRGNLFSQDVQANEINVAVLDGGEPAAISGTVTAKIIRSDGGTVSATGGTISGNIASITLPAAAYAVPGVVSITVQLTASGVITTIAAVVTNIYKTSTEATIDPGTIIPSVTALISDIEAAVASIPADYSSLWTSLAPAFSSSASYTPGQYVTYNGALYVCTTAHTGSWVAGHFAATNVGTGLSELKSAITNITGCEEILFANNKYVDLSGSSVTMSGGVPQYGSTSTTFSCARVECNAGDVFTVSGHGGSSTRQWGFVKANGDIICKASANADTYGLILTAPTDATWLIIHTNNTKKSYKGRNVGDAIIDIDGHVQEIENNNIASFSLTGMTSKYGLFKHHYKAGEKINIRCADNKCNVLAIKSSDYSYQTLISNLLPSETYTEFTFSYDVDYLGLYLYDTTKTSTIYIFDGESYRIHNVVLNKIDEEADAIDNKKVDGVIVWNEETEVTETDGKLVYGALNSTISEFTYATGHYIKCVISNNPKVRVKGYGWDQSSNFALWAFTDSSNKIIARDTENAHAASQWLEVEVPGNAAYLYVNGNQAIHAAAEVAYYSTDFSECYNAVKDAFPFKLITLGDSITKLGITDRGWVKYFMAKTGATLVANVAVDGAQLVDKAGTEYDGNPTDSNPTNNVLGNQVQKIINNEYEAPDLIMIAVGTNNGIFITAEQIKAAYYDSNNTLVPLADVDRTTGAGAYRYCTETLHNLYPNAVIVWCAPIYSAQASRRMDQIEAWGESLEIATRYSGQMWIDTFRCGINGVGETVGSNGEYLYDGLHPNAKGAQKIGLYNASKVMPFLGNLIKSGL